jgi:hypothetical protein
LGSEKASWDVLTGRSGRKSVRQPTPSISRHKHHTKVVCGPGRPPGYAFAYREPLVVLAGVLPFFRSVLSHSRLQEANEPYAHVRGRKYLPQYDPLDEVERDDSVRHSHVY